MDLRDAISSESSGVSDSCDRARRLRTEHDHLQILHDRADGALADAGSVRTGDLERGIRELIGERDEARAEIKHLADDAGPDSDADVIVRLRAERDALKTEVAEYQQALRTQGDKFSDERCEWDAQFNALKAEVERLKKELAQIEHIDAGGCLDGDCPHDHANECLEVLTAELKFVGETVRALLTEGETEEGG
jgi:chromosome segregation ATPase